MAEVVLTNLRKSYGAVVAVKDFSLHIADHEFVVLVGRPAAASRRRCA